MGVPKKKIDADQVRQLAVIQCSYEEMASVIRCNVSTLQRRFAQVIKEGRAQGRMSLKRKQYQVAMQGNVGMLIWLGKQILDQREKQDIVQTVHDSETKKVTEFLSNISEIDLVKLYISKQEKQHALSKPETKSLPLCEQTEDGKRVGHGNTEYEGLTPKSSNGSDG